VEGGFLLEKRERNGLKAGREEDVGLSLRDIFLARREEEQYFGSQAGCETSGVLFSTFLLVRRNEIVKLISRLLESRRYESSTH
jgi:hypothetical protein